MAKNNKRRAALFEVMSRAKLPNNSGSPADSPNGSSPRWWFRSSNRSDVQTLAPGQTDPLTISPAPHAADDVENDPTLRPRVHVEIDPQRVQELERQLERERERELQPEQERERERYATPLTSGLDVPPSASAPRVQPVELSVDRQTQLISLRLSYTSAMIGGAALLILLALAILIGKTLSRGPSPAIANADTKTLRQNPPTPNVMRVGRRTAAENESRGITPANDTDAANQGARPTPQGNSTGTRNPQRGPAFNAPQPPATFFTDDPKRSHNLNYVVIQTFPDTETARRAAEFLTKNGVPCTVEKDLPRWPVAWKNGCVVVGIRGFDRIRNNSDLEAYIHTIKELGVKFAGGRGRFNAFDSPGMYKWDK